MTDHRPVNSKIVGMILIDLQASGSLTRSLPESIMETCSVVLTFEAVNEILWCDHSNETCLADIFHGNIGFFSTL